MNDASPLSPERPAPGQRLDWLQLAGASRALAIVNTAREHNGLTVLICQDPLTARELNEECLFFIGEEPLSLTYFPDWETLPYDQFSPHGDIISSRLKLSHQLPSLQKGIVIISITTLMQRVAPVGYTEGNCFIFTIGQSISIKSLTERLVQQHYYSVSSVREHGEFSVRGSIIDLFPMGTRHPIRIELFDNEIESLRTFHVDSQCSLEKIDEFILLPAKEFPMDEVAISRFRQQWRENFGGNPLVCPTYQAISQGTIPAGIDYYLPLFFKETSTLFDYFPENTLFISEAACHDRAIHFFQEIQDRYKQLSIDVTRPLLPPDKLYCRSENLYALLNQQRHIVIHEGEASRSGQRFGASLPPALPILHKAEDPLAVLREFIQQYDGRILFCVESAGRREVLFDLLKQHHITPTLIRDWKSFIHTQDRICLTQAMLIKGARISKPAVCLITESELYGEHIITQRRKKDRSVNADLIIQNLAELKIGDPVVHLDHGIGRYQGLTTLHHEDIDTEFILLVYQNNDKIYVPITSLERISRYTGGDPDKAHLNRLGAPQWSKAKRQAIEKIRDVAAELLAIYAKREAAKGFAFQLPQQEYPQFVADFPFEETEDQERAIQDIINDMTSPGCMDRLICGDVGFGKTEVAMRAAFIAIQNNKQVAVLVPTTLLATQHYENFLTRFANFPVNIKLLSRFRSTSEINKSIEALKEGKVDIVIGTHKLLQENVAFHDLGLLIIDEEHRFGVQQKDKLKKIRHSVDILTLTATPIPRTLNLSMAGIRDISLIATPPAKRLSVKTFAYSQNDLIVKEAILREIMRGGQVFFLHNDIDSIQRVASDIATLVPQAKVTVAHGQMPEKSLERVMSDFYHHRFTVLVCTTIIETGIDIPTANTIIINRADKFGLAQLHQLRGRVGRSHHQAYAYLIIPDEKGMTKDAAKRIQAFLSLDDLGAGFTLATHDMEIRGAGELLGEEQSGHMQAIGFSLYMELLDRAVSALKSGSTLDAEDPFDDDIQINAHVSAIIPDDYIPDIHIRLQLYKRIATAKNDDALKSLQIEMIDRFGLIPDPIKYLFQITRIKKQALQLGIKRIDATATLILIEFNAKPFVDPAIIIEMIQKESQTYKLEGPSKLKCQVNAPTAIERLDTLSQIIHKLSR